MIISNVTFQKNKGITCSSMYVGTSQCSSTSLIMDKVTIAGGVCLANTTSVRVGELLFSYAGKYVTCKKKLLQTLHISQGNFSRNSQNRQSIQTTCTIRIAAVNILFSVFVNMTDVVLSQNMGSGLCINNIISPVLLQSVFISGNLNGAIEIDHSNVTFSGITTLTHNRGKPVYITKSNVTFTGSLYFERNHARLACTFEADGSKLIFAENTSFYDNYGGQGTLCITSGSSATFIGGRTEFIKNSVGAISASSSYLNFHGNMTFLENLANYGGGLNLFFDAVMIIHAKTYINFTRNMASH